MTRPLNRLLSTKVEFSKKLIKPLNTGSCLSIKYPDGCSDDFGASFLGEEQYHLDTVEFHWGSEIMNGSEHSVGGVSLVSHSLNSEI
jgi:hypothetical protein